MIPRAYAFKGDGSSSPFDVSVDGKRFLVIKSSDTPSPGPRIAVWLHSLPMPASDLKF